MTGLAILIFLLVMTITLIASAAVLRVWESDRKKRVGAMLSDGSESTRREPSPDLAASRRPALVGIEWLNGLDAWIRQAGLSWSAEQFLIGTLVIASAGGLLGTRLRLWPALGMVLCAIGFGLLPALYVHRKRSVRLAAFEKQFPEALDFLARAMRAGHAFSATLDMLATEAPPPLGPEFRRLYDEQNLGAPIETALRNLAVRVPLIDVRFFVSAVLLQRQTGGNLGEILRNLARVIRERFQIKGHVRAASAHGRITATILTILPVATVFGLTILAPEYLSGMANDEDGKYLIIAAVIALVSGYYFMRRIIDIKI